MGHTTLQAEDGGAALALLQRNADIDLVITDYVMPGGMDGLELIREAKARTPSVKAILTSGCMRRAVLRRQDFGDELDWIAKPYRWEEIARKLREVFETPC